jgi:hypothetical protein
MDAIATAWERMPASLKADLATGELPDVGQDGIVFSGEVNGDGRWRIVGRCGNEDRVVAFGSGAEKKSPAFYEGEKG